MTAKQNKCQVLVEALFKKEQYGKPEGSVAED
jgi:hypothetical protein